MIEFLKKLFLILLALAFVSFVAWLVFPSASTKPGEIITASEHKPLLRVLTEDILGIPKCGIFGGGCSNNGGSGTINNGGATSNIQVVNPDIHTNNLAPSAVLQNGFTVNGDARYSWFYQNVALGTVTDENGLEIGAFQIKASVKAAASAFVPFSGQILFSQPKTQTGYVIFDKANPSGDPKKRSKLYVPIVFSGAGASVGNGYFNQTAYKSCRVTGCSGEICSNKEVMSTCVYKPEYACYKQARCEIQSDGNCGFTLNTSVNACITNSRSGSGTTGTSGGGLQNPTN